jgi:hypothetical protein
MYRTVQNGILAIGALTIPLLAEYISATPGHVPGDGLDLLLYKPFDFAYVLLVTCLFLTINIRCSVVGRKSVGSGLFIGIVLAIAWFIVAFLALGQLHLSLGGKL